ncbi:MAG: hypothetical protein IPI45_02080 [Saprospiraceae bacterium]|nr:hypothetical protein [Saprospiraceae bacterium]MBK7736542.1 hypothetical protein [Saprospiraceae bacterium]MBK7912094.1 hypothetical protein [Saprospiraceae bacterium]
MTSDSKLLIVSWAIPPLSGGSSYITHQLAKQFKPEEIIIAGGTKSFFKKSAVYDEIKYHYFFSEINWKGHGDRYFVLFRWLLFPIVLYQLIRLIRNQKPTAVLACFPDPYYLIASKFAATYFKLPFYSYFHNTLVENRSGISKWIAKKIQNTVFNSSRIIFTMSTGMQSYYSKTYPQWKEKFDVLPHTFNEYPHRTVQKSFNQNPPYKLVLIGTFNHSNMEATSRLLQLLSKYPELYQLDIYTSTQKPIFKYKWNLDLDELGIHYKGYVNQELVDNVLQNYDACLLTHGFEGAYSDIEYQTIFPTRMLPFLLSGVPIVAHIPGDVFLAEFIRSYDCAQLICSKEEQAILEGLQMVTTNPNRRQTLISNAQKTTPYFYGKQVVDRLKMKIFILGE